MLLIVAEILLLAPLLIFNEVRANAAVAGIPPANPEARLANPSPKNSRRLSCFVLVMLSAILADNIVSKIAIKATVKLAVIRGMSIKNFGIFHKTGCKSG